MSVKIIKGIDLYSPDQIGLGKSKIGASYLPANTIMRIRYHNVDGAQKTFSACLDYLY